ncbi:MAG: serpin family protein [Phycisphaerae bacterium]
MKLTVIVVIACVTGLAMWCMAQSGAPKDAPKAAPAEADVAAVAKDGDAFAMDMYAKLATKEGNIFFSPASIDTALAMTYAGARGRTAEQMAKTLHFSLPPDKLNPAFAALIDKLNHPAEVNEFDEGGKIKKVPAYQLTVSNALWGQKGYPFKADFTNLVAKDYGAAMNEVDYAKPEIAREVINKWVANQTKDKIQDLIPPGALDTLTRLVLTNAVYFKSNWEEKFQKQATKDEAFHVTADDAVKTPLMHQTRHFNYMENDDLQAVELPYNSRQLSMVVLLPRKLDGLPALEKSLTAGNVAKWLAALADAKVELTLPKFKFTSQFGLGDTLKSMGMTDAFDANKADFSGMTAEEKLYISAVIHKAFVAVDEEGTEAAAATAVVMRAGAAMPRPEETRIFKADHPFVFLIRHNATGEILFMGKVANPKE